MLTNYRAVDLRCVRLGAEWGILPAKSLINLGLVRGSKKLKASGRWQIHRIAYQDVLPQSRCGWAHDADEAHVNLEKRGVAELPHQFLIRGL